MNIKKLFPDKSSFSKRISGFLYKNGFYFALILCIAIVGITAIFITTYNFTSKPYVDDSKIISEDLSGYNYASSINTEDEKLSSTTASPSSTGGDDKKVAGASSDKNANPEVSQNSVQSQVKGNANSNAADKNSTQKADVISEIKLSMPVFGEYIQEYAMDKPVYWKTLEEWRTHSGIDIAAERGTPVKAAAGGVVADVKADPRFGITVIIDHQNGLKTVYANLASGEMVAPNQIVELGDVIGSIGNTAKFESIDQPHLHFEVLKDGKPVDPMAYLPQSQIKK